MQRRAIDSAQNGVEFCSIMHANKFGARYQWSGLSRSMCTRALSSLAQLHADFSNDFWPPNQRGDGNGAAARGVACAIPASGRRRSVSPLVNVKEAQGAQPMTLTVNQPDREAQRLAEKAQAACVDVQKYVEWLVRVAATSPSLSEVLRPVHDAFHASGMSEDELGDLLEQATHEMRGERRARQAP
jgi:hypothetical protein